MASGTDEVSVIPGETFDLEEGRLAVRGDDQVGPGQVPQPEHVVHPQGKLGAPLGDLRVDLGRAEEPGRSRGVAGGVVVDPRLRPDLDPGSASGPDPRSTTAMAISVRR